MKIFQITFEIDSDEDILNFLHQKAHVFFIHKFCPNPVLEWWETEFITQNNIEFKDLSVRMMKMDVQTDVEGLKKILKMNTNQLYVFQFDRKLSDTLWLESLPENRKFEILKENGLKQFFNLDFEYITISSFEEKAIDRIELTLNSEKRLFTRK